jgi:hypothetical protein
MMRIDEIERLLGQTPPAIVEGPHRQQLKQRLLAEPPAILRSKTKMQLPVFRRMSPALKIAACVLAATFLVGIGWAAERIYAKLKFTKASLTLEVEPPGEWPLPNGMKLTTSGSIGTVVTADDPKATETAQRHHKEMKELIGKKKIQAR